jgi:AcrR family transcriptional regulator
MYHNTAVGPDGKAAGGRPRDPRIDGAVLEAVRQLLVEVGYPRLSFELIARRAGVTRPAIYRRWPSKVHLVYEAVFPEPGTAVIEDTGDFAADVRRLVRRNLMSYARPEARAALPGLLSDLHGDSELRHSVLDGLENQVRAQFALLVAGARRRGEVATDADPDAVLDVIVGAIFHRVIARDDTADDFAEALASLVLDGVRRSRGSGPEG